MSLARAFRGFTPFANRVLIKRAEAVTKTAGGIMLPETAQTKEGFKEKVTVSYSNRVYRGMSLEKNHYLHVTYVIYRM